jgi:hypothetical protein
MRDKLHVTVLGAFGVAAAITAIACGGSSQPVPAPEQKADVTGPDSGLRVTADIASVTLGEECTPEVKAAECPGGFCSGYCESNLQLAFLAAAGGKGAAIEIVKAELLDGSSGEVVDTLAASRPRIWNGTAFVAWDQDVTPGGDLKASYEMTAPAWSKIEGPQPEGTSSLLRTFKLRLTLHLDGVEVVLQSSSLVRQGPGTG